VTVSSQPAFNRLDEPGERIPLPVPFRCLVGIPGSALRSVGGGGVWWFVTLLVASLTTVLAHGPLHGQISELDAQLEQQPANAELLLRRADLHRLDGNAAAAMADLTAVEKITPVPDGLWWVRGRLLVEQQRPEAALVDLNRWLERHPRHEGALTVRARVREQAQDFAGAVVDYTHAIAAADNPGPDLFLARARVQRQQGPEHFEAALCGLDEGIARLGNLVTLQLEAIDLERALARTEAALTRLDTLIQQATRKESWFARRAELLDHANRSAEAQQAWKQTLESCLALSPRLRQKRATQELEQRVRRNLSAALIAEVERNATPPASSQANPPSTAAHIRTIPIHERFAP
jgi:tetratricopeptide (TPR) repeat protein